MNRREKKIVFEKIRLIHYPFAKYYLWKGYEVSVFDFDYNLKKTPWLRRLINENKISRIYVSPMIRGHGEAIDQTEIIYSRLKKKNLERPIERLYQSPEVSLVFKKWLVQEVVQALYIHGFLEEAGPVCFVPNNYSFYLSLIRKQGTLSLKKLQTVKVARWGIFCGFLFRGIEKGIFLLGVWGALFLKSVCMLLGSGTQEKAGSPRFFKYGIPIHQEFEIQRGFDFLLDGKKLSKENTVFLLRIPVSPDWLQSYQEKGYHFVNAGERLGFRGALRSRAPFKNIVKALWALMGAPLYLFHPLPLLQGYLRCVRVYLDHQLIFDRLVIQNYIYRNQESGNQIAMNILLRGEGVTTWDYIYSISAGYLCSSDRKEFKLKRSFLFAFLNSDHFVIGSEDLAYYHRLHLQNVRHYHVVGNLYSGLVREIQNNASDRRMAPEPLRRPCNSSQKTVAFFDTSFVDFDNCVTTFEHAINFYADILRLLKEREDVFLIIKPAKDESYFISPKAQWSSPRKGGEIIRLWDLLKKHKKVFWASHTANAAEVIALSDLVITHAYSSPTAEALGVGKKAFWYQSKGRQPFLYHAIPGLVVYGYEALKERIDELLYATDNQRHQKYLERHIKGSFDPFVDGLGLTRFRQLLCEEAP